MKPIISSQAQKEDVLNQAEKQEEGGVVVDGFEGRQDEAPRARSVDDCTQFSYNRDRTCRFQVADREPGRLRFPQVAFGRRQTKVKRRMERRGCSAVVVVLILAR